MAKFKLSAIGITAIRGTIGGQTFSSNRGGIYVKNWAKPTNPMTPAQTKLRNMFGTVVRSWKLLTEAQRNDWEAYGATRTSTDILGESRTMTGRTAFISVNQNLLHIDKPLSLNVPTQVELLSFYFSSVTENDQIVVHCPDYVVGLAGTNFVSLRFSKYSNASKSYVSKSVAVTRRIPITGVETAYTMGDIFTELGIGVGDDFLINAHMHNTAGEKSNIVTYVDTKVD